MRRIEGAKLFKTKRNSIFIRARGCVGPYGIYACRVEISFPGMARVKTDDAVCDFATLEFAADIDQECKTASVDKFVGDKCDAQFHRKINRRSVPGLRRSIVRRSVAPTQSWKIRNRM